MAYSKVNYNRVNWINKEVAVTTPLGATNLNNMDSTIYNIANQLDQAYIQLNNEKANTSTVNDMLKSVSYVASTGVFTFTYQNGKIYTVDLNVEKIPVDFSMDEKGIITMTTADGTKYIADISSMLHEYNFVDNDVVAVTKEIQEDGSYSVSISIKKGSITDEYLEDNYLSTILQSLSSAETEALNAQKYAEDSLNDAKLAQSYAVGTGNIVRDIDETDNAKYYKDQAKNYAESAASLSNMYIGNKAGYEEIKSTLPDGAFVAFSDL